MKIEHLTNTLICFGSEIQSQLAACRSFSLATAFISTDAIDLIEHNLKKNKALKECRLLVGLYGCFNSKADLERLNALAQQYAGKLQVHISKNKAFHWKYYQFSFSGKEIIYSGSANFTSGGLSTNGEFMLKLTLQKADERTSKKLSTSFDSEWANSGSISIFPFSAYPSKAKIAAIKWPKELLDFFEPTEPRTKTNSIISSEKAFAIYLTGDVRKETKEMVNNYNPHWQATSDDFFVLRDKSRFEKCKAIGRLLIFERIGRGQIDGTWAKPVGFCDTLRTKDGMYFVAYKRISQIKSINSAIEESLKRQFGINLRAIRNRFETKILGKRQVLEIEDVIGS